MKPSDLNGIFVSRLERGIPQEPPKPFVETLWGLVDAQGVLVPPMYQLGQEMGSLIRERMQQPSVARILFPVIEEGTK